MCPWRPSERSSGGIYLQVASEAAQVALWTKFVASGAGYETGRPVGRLQPASPLAGALQNVAGMGQFRPETRPGARFRGLD